MFGGIEGGGTKFVCAVGTGPDEIVDEVRFPSAVPEVAFPKIIEFFKRHPQIKGLGLGFFGPLHPDPLSPKYGHIGGTVKPGWTGVDVVGRLRHALGVPIGFDTDVNAAALGEATWGAGRGLRNVLYLTIGTGIGGGAVVEGNLVHGLLHPEMGHIRIPHERLRDLFDGDCIYHGDCFEGLASGSAINARWKMRAETLPPDHQAWDLEADYIAMALQSYLCVLSPQRIILGGGVMEQRHLFPKIRTRLKDLLKGYIQVPEILERMDEYVVPPSLGNRAGVLGAIALGKMAAEMQ